MKKQPTLESIGKRIFARELKKALLGYHREKAEHSSVADAVDEQLQYELTKANWSYCWNGHYYPLKYLKEKIDAKFDYLYSSWSEEYSAHNRVMLHLRCLSLIPKLSSAKSEDALTEAQTILNRIHREWRPMWNKTLQVPMLEKHIGESPIFNEEDDFSQFLEAFELGILKRELCLMPFKLKTDTAKVYDVLTPASVIKYLIKVAFETRLNVKGLKAALIFDLLSATLCLKIIMNYNMDEMRKEGLKNSDSATLLYSSDYQTIYSDIEDMFWTYVKKGSISFDIDPFFYNIFEVIGIEPDEADIQLLGELWCTYYAVLEYSGIEKETLNELLSRRIGDL